MYNEPTVSQTDVKKAIKDIRMSNMNKLIFGRLNINSLRNKFDLFNEKVKGCARVSYIFLWYLRLNWMIVSPKLNF